MQAETVALNPFAVAAIQADAGILPVGVPRYCRGMEPVAVYSCEIGRHQRDTVCALSVKVIVCYAEMMVIPQPVARHIQPDVAAFHPVARKQQMMAAGASGSGDALRIRMA